MSCRKKQLLCVSLCCLEDRLRWKHGGLSCKADCKATGHVLTFPVCFVYAFHAVANCREVLR